MQQPAREGEPTLEADEQTSKVVAAECSARVSFSALHVFRVKNIILSLACPGSLVMLSACCILLDADALALLKVPVA